MSTTTTPAVPRPRPRPRSPYLALDGVAAELEVPAEVLADHADLWEAGRVRPNSMPPLHRSPSGERVIMRADLNRWAYLQVGDLVYDGKGRLVTLDRADDTPLIGYGLMVTWCGRKEQTLWKRLHQRGKHIEKEGRARPRDIIRPYGYTWQGLGKGRRLEPRWQAAELRTYWQWIGWLGRDGVTPAWPRPSGPPPRA